MSLRDTLAVTAAIVIILMGIWIFSGPSYAEPSPTCKYTMDEVISTEFAPKGIPFEMIKAEDLPDLLAKLEAATGQKYEGVTRAFVANISGNVILGLEVGGCLIDPILLATVPAPMGDKSGRVGSETFA